jgi:antitoxin ParD1/3/4
MSYSKENSEMNVSLTPELEAMVQEKVKSGDYNSASEVVREALRLLKKHEEMLKVSRESLRAELIRGINDIETGRNSAFKTADELVDDSLEKHKRKEVVN